MNQTESVIIPYYVVPDVKSVRSKHKGGEITRRDLSSTELLRNTLSAFVCLSEHNRNLYPKSFSKKPAHGDGGDKHLDSSQDSNPLFPFISAP